MRVAMIGPFGLYPKATMSVRALPLAEELVRRGHSVRVIMPPWHTPQEAGRVWAQSGVTLEYVSLTPRIPALRHLSVTWRLVQRALAWKADIVHCFKPKADAGLAASWLWLWRGLTRARLVVDEDDWEGPGGWNDLDPYSPIQKALFAWQERHGLRHCHAVTVASRTLQSLVWSLGVPPYRVYYLPNGSALSRHGDGERVRAQYGLGESPVMLLYTRFFEYDVKRIVDVFSVIRAQVPEARLLVVGKGLHAEDDVRFDHLVAERGLSGCVIRAGWVPQAELPDYLAAADVALYPFDDNLVNRAKCAVKLIDLLAAGVAVVADAVGQNAEYIVHHESGWLVASGDVAAMAHAAVRLLHDDPLRRALGQAAARRIGECFEWRTLTEQALAAYEGR